MPKFCLEIHQTGKFETFDFDGTREEYIAQRFGTGGLNNTFATLTEVIDADIVEDKPKKASKKDVQKSVIFTPNPDLAPIEEQDPINE